MYSSECEIKNPRTTENMLPIVQYLAQSVEPLGEEDLEAGEKEKEVVDE